MITPETVKQFQQAVGTACWNMSYQEFCHKLGRATPDDWTAKKWREFQEFEQTLRAFDPVTLAKLLAPAPPKINAAAVDPTSGESWTAEEILRREG